MAEELTRSEGGSDGADSLITFWFEVRALPGPPLSRIDVDFNTIADMLAFDAHNVATTKASVGDDFQPYSLARADGPARLGIREDRLSELTRG